MFIHPEISRELALDRQRGMLAYVRHRRLKNILTAARAEGPKVIRPGAYQGPFRLLRTDECLACRSQSPREA